MIKRNNLEIGQKIKSKSTGNVYRIVDIFSECVDGELIKKSIDETRELGMILHIKYQDIKILEKPNKYFLKKRKKVDIND